MEAIFGSALATGRYALGSGEALGQNQADSGPVKAEGSPFIETPGDKAPTATAEGSKATKPVVGGKRKRGTFTEEEIIMLNNMSDAVNNVANALRETGPAHVDANLYLVVMEMPDFSQEALIVSYTYLLDNKAQGRGFVNMTNSHRTLWLQTFLAKNYFM
jgi:hypothetical protein